IRSTGMGSTEIKDLLVGRCIPGKPVCPATTAEISLHEDIIRELTGFYAVKRPPRDSIETA
ncbi:MAG: hypothetical protein WCH39_12655, partial [Schlesneria sp.]